MLLKFYSRQGLLNPVLYLMMLVASRYKQRESMAIGGDVLVLPDWHLLSDVFAEPMTLTPLIPFKCWSFCHASLPGLRRKRGKERAERL